MNTRLLVMNHLPNEDRIEIFTLRRADLHGLGHATNGKVQVTADEELLWDESIVSPLLFMGNDLHAVGGRVGERLKGSGGEGSCPLS